MVFSELGPALGMLSIYHLQVWRKYPHDIVSSIPGKWKSPETTGSPPPACQGCTLTRIDYHRAITFGGGGLVKLLPNHIHILDIQSWVRQVCVITMLGCYVYMVCNCFLYVSLVIMPSLVQFYHKQEATTPPRGTLVDVMIQEGGD